MSISRKSYTDSINFFGKESPLTLVKKFGSPLYVYNEEILRKSCQDMKNLVCLDNFSASYSTKANANPHLLKIIRHEGLMADAMSPGELALLHRAGFSKDEIIYVCNNVSETELRLAAENALVLSVDSVDQLDRYGDINPGGSVMIRVNPGVGAGHHKKVITAGKDTKFGISPEDFSLVKEICENKDIKLIGLNQHVGSLFMDPKPYLEAAKWLLNLALSVFPGVEFIDFGGGFGIPYHKYDDEASLDLASFGKSFTDLLKSWQEENNYSGRFLIEPGRYVAAESGLLLGKVQAVKENAGTRFVGTDMGFSVLARPIIYDAFHDVEVYPSDNNMERSAKEVRQTIVGNICESGDILAKDRLLPEIFRDDIIGILDAGAYGHVMSSNYNQRLRPAEVLIKKDGFPVLIRRRDKIEDLLEYYP